MSGLFIDMPIAVEWRGDWTGGELVVQSADEVKINITVGDNALNIKMCCYDWAKLARMCAGPELASAYATPDPVDGFDPAAFRLQISDSVSIMEITDGYVGFVAWGSEGEVALEFRLGTAACVAAFNIAATIADEVADKYAPANND